MDQLPFWSRRTFLATAATTLAASKLHAEPLAESLVYVGTTARGEGAGIHVATWNAAKGALLNLRLTAPADNAGFLAASNLGGARRLFAGHQLANNAGALSSWEIAANGDLKLINTITVPAFDFVHTALDHTQRCLVTASYGTGKVLSVKRAADGRLSEPVSQIQLTGHGPNASRQLAPHAHGVAFSPDNRFVLINDLGTDRIMIYKINPATAALTPNDPAFFAGAPGSGPRHLTFHPNGKWAYSVNEIDSTITQMSWNAAAGTLTLLATTPTLPHGGDAANNRAGEVVFDRSGRVLYSCNRQAPDEVLVYSVGVDGALSLIQRVDFKGKEARHFAISPDGGYFVLAEQFSNRVSVFTRRADDGSIARTANEYPVVNPACILFIL